MKKYPLKKIHTKRTYTPKEVSGLLKVTIQTVYKWLKVDGLKQIDLNESLTLIMGQDLKDFLHVRHEKTKAKLQDGEIYCVGCKKPVFPKEGTARIEATGKKMGKNGMEQKRMVGKCSRCGKEVHRILAMQ